MKKFITIILFLIVGILLIIWLYHKIGIIEVFSVLKILRLWQIAILFSLSCVTIFIWIIHWKIILKALAKKHFSYRDLMEAYLGGNSMSYLTPVTYYGGEAFRILMLRNKTKIPVTTVTTSVILDKLAELMGLCLFSFLGASLLIIKGSFVWAFFLTGFGLLILLFMVVVFKWIGFKKIMLFFSKFIPKKKREGKLKNLTQKIKFIGTEAADAFKKTPYIFYQTTILSCLIFFIDVLSITLFIFFLKGNFNLINAIPMKILLVLSSFIPIPASLGSLEVAGTLAFNSFGYSASLGLAYCLVRRFIDFSIVLVGMSFILRYTAKGLLLKKINFWNYH